MATDQELYNLWKNSDIRVKCQSALGDIIIDILQNDDTDANGYDDVTTNHDLRQKWAVDNSANIVAESRVLLYYVLRKNQASTVSTIEAATTEQFKNNLKDLLLEWVEIKGA